MVSSHEMHQAVDHHSPQLPRVGKSSRLGLPADDCRRNHDLALVTVVEREDVRGKGRMSESLIQDSALPIRQEDDRENRRKALRPVLPSHFGDRISDVLPDRLD